MTTEDYILEAADIVSTWEIADEDLSQTIMAQAQLMAGLDIYYSDDSNTAFH